MVSAGSAPTIVGAKVISKLQLCPGFTAAVQKLLLTVKSPAVYGTMLVMARGFVAVFKPAINVPNNRVANIVEHENRIEVLGVGRVISQHDRSVCCHELRRRSLQSSVNIKQLHFLRIDRHR